MFTRTSDSLGERVAHLARHACNAISATPTLWRKILMTPESRELNPRQITLGGEIVDQQSLNAPAGRGASYRASILYCRVYRVRAQRFSVNDGQAGFPRNLLNAPPPGLELRVNQEGYLLIRPELREQSYISGDTTIFDEAGFVNTGDLVTSRDERIFFLGRANGTINVGGNKVPPEEVESVLHAIPGVRLARVYGKRSSITGTLVAADIQAEAGITELDALRRAITSQCSRSLAEYKVPAMIRFVSVAEDQRKRESGTPVNDGADCDCYWRGHVVQGWLSAPALGLQREHDVIATQGQNALSPQLDRIWTLRAPGRPGVFVRRATSREHLQWEFGETDREAYSRGVEEHFWPW